MEKFHAALGLSLKKENIVVRQKASSGIWVSFLLPATILVAGWKSECPLYMSSRIYSLNLLLNVFHLLYHIIRNKSLYVTKSLNILCVIPSSITLFFYIDYLELDFRQGLYYTVANALIYFEGLPFILKVFPNSFSFGEANLIIQGISIFLHSTFTRLNKVLLNTIPDDEYNRATTILQIGHVGMLVLCIVPFVLHKMRNTLSMYIWILVVMFGFIMNTASYILGDNPILWLWEFFMKKERLSVLSLWVACCVMSGLICWHRVRTKKPADTVSRKYFHILGDVVFTSGVIFDPTLIYFASGSALALFVLLEVFRITKIPPLYAFLEDTFVLYKDEKDSGVVALTPIYLLIGFSIPLWLHPKSSYGANDFLPLLSGVLCVGVGDTCASIVGKTFGRHRWKGTSKSKEGTIACICGQIIFVLVLEHANGLSYSGFQHLKIFSAILIPSLVEAFTDQIDNIALPLITYILLMV